MGGTGHSMNEAEALAHAADGPQPVRSRCGHAAVGTDCASSFWWPSSRGGWAEVRRIGCAAERRSHAEAEDRRRKPRPEGNHRSGDGHHPRRLHHGGFGLCLSCAFGRPVLFATGERSHFRRPGTEQEHHRLERGRAGQHDGGIGGRGIRVCGHRGPGRSHRSQRKGGDEDKERTADGDWGPGFGQPQEVPTEGEGSASATGTESRSAQGAPAQKANGDEGFFGDLFRPMAEEDATPIDSLIDSLPDITGQELANDAREVRGLLLRRRGLAAGK